MASRKVVELKSLHDEKKVLGTLASIKTQVTSVLKNIQEARESAAEVAYRHKNMDKVNESITSPGSLPSSPASRDDVKAQREAKKAAKAARKSKGNDTPPIQSSPVGHQSVTTSTQSSEPLLASSPVVVKSGGGEETPKSKGQLKSARRAIQEAQREAKANTPPTGKYKTIVAKSESSPKASSPSNPKAVSPTTELIGDQMEDPSEPLNPEEHETSVLPESENQEIPSPGSPSVPDQTVQDSASPTKQSINVSKNGNSELENKTNDKENNLNLMGRIHGLFECDVNPLVDEDEIELEFVDVDPIFKELGLKYSNGMIRGSNQRTVALLKSVKKFVKEYRTPDGKGFKPDLSTKLKYSFDRLKLSRPFAVGMNSAIDGLNAAIRRLEEGLADEIYKESLEDWCDTFIEEKVDKAVEAIAQKGCEKIEDGDTILVFSLTDVIYHVFKLAGEQQKKFTLLLAITNSDTYLKDYEQLRKSMGVEIFKKNVLMNCINISSIMSLISTVDKVFLGGHALFTTGGVMAHAGSSTIALCAMQHNIPTLFFCETFKFCDKSPTDAFYRDVFFENKISPTNQHKKVDDDINDSLNNSRKERGMMAKIRYDFTPVNLVTCVITDIDMLPSSSVPVVLRVQETRPLITKCLQ